MKQMICFIFVLNYDGDEVNRYCVRINKPFLWVLFVLYLVKRHQWYHQYCAKEGLYLGVPVVLVVMRERVRGCEEWVCVCRWGWGGGLCVLIEFWSQWTLLLYFVSLSALAMVVYLQQYLVSKVGVEVVRIVASLIIWKLSFVTVTLNGWLSLCLGPVMDWWLAGKCSCSSVTLVKQLKNGCMLNKIVHMTLDISA